MTDWRLGVDIGGTFTDVVAHNLQSKETRSAKVPSNKSDQIQSLLAAIAGVDLAWEDISDLTHGTTIVTNDIVENQTDAVALITTEGFRDTLAIGRSHRKQLYYLDRAPKLPPLVPRNLRFEVAERVNRNGAIVVELSEQEIARIVAEVKGSGVRAVAVCLIHAYKNEQHEVALGKAIAEVVDHVCLSHEISPVIREYERTNTTVLSASVVRRVRTYLDRIDSHKPSSSNLHFFHSSGGMAAPDVVKQHPLQLAMSGPAAGVTAAVDIMQTLGIEQGLTFDMGGTTTDTCLIVDGRPEVSSEQELGERRIRFPMVSVHSIGAGGGSIARMDNGVLRVGPRSAGALPGPACYCLGGQDPTISDANIVLGYLNPDRTLGGKIKLDRDAAVTAIQPIAAEAGRTVKETALGILSVANSNMVRALNKVTVERGVDGRDCTLIAFGGSGPIHAVSVARQYGIKSVVVPAYSSGFSALGCITARMSYSRQRTVNVMSDAWDPALVRQTWEDLLATISAPMTHSGLDPATCQLELVAMVRYVGQSFDVPIENAELGDLARLQEQFYQKHEILFGFYTDEPWELVAIRAVLSEPERKAIPHRVAATTGAGQIGARLCTFDDGSETETPIFDRRDVAQGTTMAGPVIIEDEWSTTLVQNGDTATFDQYGHIQIDVGRAQ